VGKLRKREKALGVARVLCFLPTHPSSPYNRSNGVSETLPGASSVSNNGNLPGYEGDRLHFLICAGATNFLRAPQR